MKWLTGLIVGVGILFFAPTPAQAATRCQGIFLCVAQNLLNHGSYEAYERCLVGNSKQIIRANMLVRCWKDSGCKRDVKACLAERCEGEIHDCFFPHD